MRRCLSLLAALTVAAGASPAGADFRLEKHLALAPGGTLRVDAEGGRVTVRGGDADGVSVLITSSRDDVDSRYTFDFKAEPGKVEVINKRRRGARDGGWWSWFDWNTWNVDGAVNMEIRVPRATRIDVRSSGGGLDVADLAGDARLRSSGGRIEAAQIVGGVDAESSGGRVEIADVDGDVVASSSGGGVDVARVSGGVEASSSGGGVRLEGVGGRVLAESSGGSVSAVLAAGHTGGGSLSSSGGGVRIEVAADARLSIDAYSSGGNVHCDLPVARQGKVSRTALRGDLNGGGAPLTLRSSGGGIYIRPGPG